MAQWSTKVRHANRECEFDSSAESTFSQSLFDIIMLWGVVILTHCSRTSDVLRRSAAVRMRGRYAGGMSKEHKQQDESTVTCEVYR